MDENPNQDSGFSQEARLIFDTEWVKAYEKGLATLKSSQDPIDSNSFKTLHNSLGNTRREIARQCNTDGHFGISRAGGSGTITPLSERDRAHAEEISALCTKRFLPIPGNHDLSNSNDTLEKIHVCDFVNERIRLNHFYGYYSPELLDEKMWVFHKHILGVRPSFAEKAQELANNRKLGQIRLCPTHFTEGQQIPISTICGLIEMEKDHTISAATIEAFYNHSSFLIHHTSSENIDLLMKECEKHWIKAMHWQDDEKTLLSHIAAVYWFHSHAMPFDRGSEAVAKWLCDLTAGYHDRKLVYKPDHLDLMPFVKSLEDYTAWFIDNVCFDSIN